MGTQQTSLEGTWQDMPSLLAAAHELKSPLVLIRQLALQLKEAPDDVVLDRMRLTAERSLRLVEGLTRSARLEDALFESEPIAVNALYEDIAHEMTPLARALSQSIEVKLPARQMTIVANHDLLRSILLGLCDNALTHNDSSQAVRLYATKHKQRIVTHVRDFGPRTSVVAGEKMPLGSSPMPIGGSPRSSGLGLMIAKQFADHMNADISLRRHQTGGSTFSVHLPESRQMSLMELLS